MGEASPARIIISPDKFGAELPDARVTRVRDNSKVAVDIPTRVYELRMIEDVEEFTTELESSRFRDLNPLGHAYVEIIDARAMEKSPVGRSECSKRGVMGECLRQEIASGSGAGSCRIKGRAILIHFAWIYDVHRADKIWHVRRRTSRQRDIFTALLHLDRKAGGKTSYALKLPALRQPLRQSAKSSVEWDRPYVAHHKIVVHIRVGQPTAQPRILEINQVVKR